jgi:uncharacterized damage-inducible protein DinB
MTSEQSKILYRAYAENMKRETETTEKVIRAIPDDKKGYRPDPKSKSADELAWHIATSEVWFLDTVLKGKAEMGEEAPVPPTIGGILEWYQTNYRDRVAKLESLPADKLSANISLFGTMDMPAVAYLDMMKLHTAHHRGQLSTYLRPMGSKVPSIYGGSADEPFQA